MFACHCVCEHSRELTRQHLPCTLTLPCRGLSTHLISYFNLISNSWHCQHSHATAQACSTCAQGRYLGQMHRCDWPQLLLQPLTCPVIFEFNQLFLLLERKKKKGLCKQSAVGTANFQHQSGQALQNYLGLMCLFVPPTIMLIFLLYPALTSGRLVVQHT